MANVERPLLNLLKTKLEDGRAYVEGLQKRGIGILSNANILQIAEKIFLEKEIKNVQTQNIVESNNGYVGIRFSWNFQEITNNGFDPQTECDSIEIGVNIATKTLSFVQVGEESLLGTRKRKLEQGVEYLSHKEWKKNPELIKEALVRAVENPQRVKSPTFT